MKATITKWTLLASANVPKNIPWYSTHIGKTFEVIEAKHTNLWYKVISGDFSNQYICKSDCLLITDAPRNTRLWLKQFWNQLTNKFHAPLFYC